MAYYVYVIWHYPTITYIPDVSYISIMLLSFYTIYDQLSDHFFHLKL